MFNKSFLFMISLLVCFNFQLIEFDGFCQQLEGSEETIQIIADEVNEVEKILRSPAFIDIVPTQDAYQRFESVSEVLSERVGVQTKRFGGMGSYSTISIRGSNPNQVVIYLDGIPLNDAKFGEVNLDNLPIDNLERIEIYRGSTPVRFGISGIGGVVNLVTKKTREHVTNIVSTSYGSYDTYKITLSRSQKIGDFDYMAFFNTRGSKGDFDFYSDNGTPMFNFEDDRWEKRKNNDHFAYSGTVKAGYDFDNIRVSIMNDYFYKDQGLPGQANSEIRDISFTTARNIINLKAEASKLASGNVNANFNAFYALRRDLFDNSEGEKIGLSSGSMKQKGIFDSLGCDLTTEVVLPELLQTLTVLLSFQREMYKSKETSYYTKYIEETSPVQARNRFTVALEDEFTFFDDRLQIVPQLRFEQWTQKFCKKDSNFFGSTDIEIGKENSKSHYEGQIGLKFYPFNSSFFIKGNIGKNYRAPTFTELFGERGYIVGNPTLKPEKAFNRDIGCGVNQKMSFFFFDWINLEYAFFYNTIDDIIIFLHNSQWTIKAQNVDEARNMGHEISLSMSMFNHLIISGNYTLQKCIDKSEIRYYNGNYLPHP